MNTKRSINFRPNFPPEVVPIMREEMVDTPCVSVRTAVQFWGLTTPEFEWFVTQNGTAVCRQRVNLAPMISVVNA